MLPTQIAVGYMGAERQFGLRLASELSVQPRSRVSSQTCHSD